MTRQVNIKSCFQGRRKGEKPPTPEPETVEISDSESEHEAGPSSPHAPFRGAKPPGEDVSDVEDENAELDDDFIEHDSDNDVAVELPVAFSRHSHQDLNVSFKTICKDCMDLSLLNSNARALHPQVNCMFISQFSLNGAGQPL